MTKAAVHGLSTECSARIVDFRFQHVVLRDGSSLLVPPDGGDLVPASRFRRLPDHVPSLPPPRLNGQVPIATASVNLRDKFIGVWRDGSRFTLAAFSETSTRPPTVIATTGRPVERLSYWTAPHEGAGVIDFISRGKGGAAMLVRYRWDHHDFRW